LWLDPELASVYVAIIADEFVIYDEMNRDFYDESFRTASAALDGLADELDAELQAIPESRRKLVVSSAALTHFARRFGLQVVATAKPQGSETHAQAVQRIAQLVEDESVPAVFAEYGHDASIVEEAASMAGVPVCTVYTDVASANVPDYDSLMRANVAELLRCLSE